MNISPSLHTTPVERHTKALQAALSELGGQYAVTIRFGEQTPYSDIKAGKLVRDVENRINRKLLGGRYDKEKNAHRLAAVECIPENIHTDNPHLHGIVRIPLEIQSRMHARFDKGIDPKDGYPCIWIKITSPQFPSATCMLKEIRNEAGWMDYISKFVGDFYARYGRGPDLIIRS